MAREKLDLGTHSDAGLAILERILSNLYDEQAIKRDVLFNVHMGAKVDGDTGEVVNDYFQCAAYRDAWLERANIATATYYRWDQVWQAVQARRLNARSLEGVR